MASQTKIKFTEAERKKLTKYIKSLPKEMPREECYEQEYMVDGPYGRRRIRRPIQRGIIMSDKINHCKSGGGTMSECSACNLKRTEKHESQKKCHFYQKASFKERCTFETFGEYCWCVEAQTEAKKG